MRAGILKAMTKCCDRNAIGACGNIVYTRGSIYATDKYVLVKIDWEHDDPEMYDREDMNLDWDAVKAAKPSEDIDVMAILVERDVRTPKFDSYLKEPRRRNDGYEYAVDPKLMRKVVDVFSAADCPMQAEDWGQMTHYHGYSNRGKLLIDAIVMHERLR